MASKTHDVSSAAPGDVDVEDRPKEKRRVSTSGKGDRRDREYRNSMPSPSSLSSLLSSTMSAHRSPHGTSRPQKSSRHRTSESDLVFPSSSSSARDHRVRQYDDERGNKPHRSSSATHKSSSRRKAKDGGSYDKEPRIKQKRSRASPAADPDDDPDPDLDEPKPRSASLSLPSSTVDLVPEMSRSRDRLPYPSVNKAFSRESIMSREDLSAPSRASAGSADAGAAASAKRRGGEPLTPDATDLSAGASGASMQRSKSAGTTGSRVDRLTPASASGPSSRKSSRSRSNRHHDRPPSPPDTNFSNPKETKQDRARADQEDNDEKHDADPDLNSNTHKSQTSRVRVRRSKDNSTPDPRDVSHIREASVSPPSPIDKAAQDATKSPPSDMASSQATYKGDYHPQKAKEGQTARLSQRQRQPRPLASDVDFSPESAQDSSSPKTPTPEVSPKFYAGPDWKQPPPPPHPHPHLQNPQKYGRTAAGAAPAVVVVDRVSETPSPAPTNITNIEEGSELSTTPSPEDEATASMASAIPPPPPPPPNLNIPEVPRIDYLMQNGGLSYVVPKNFLGALPRQNGSRPSNPPLQGAETLFAPFFSLLDKYQTVLQNHGSIAVATGHRTVARRLLDRLENVFSRELPPEGCSCIVCESGGEYHRGLGWGEVLERVSGRIDLPTWPPLNITQLEQRLDATAVAAAAVGGGVGAAAGLPLRPASPVKIDPDIAEEFREHYLRQNKKVRASVDRWMRDCAEAPASAPQEIDDETLAFAILTNLNQDDRPLFNALLSGARELQPAVRAPTPMRKPRQDFIVKTGLAIQRLYRLSTAPRDAETALYLVKNPEVHDLLHTIADIHPSEWEILISGRFDGFLWSGADEDDVTTPIANAPSGFFPTMAIPPGSRGPTPASGMMSNPVSRNTTPASFASGYSAATSNASTNATRQAVSTDEEAEVAALAEIEREIYLGMEALEDAFESLHRHAETVRTALRQRSAGLSMRLQQRRGGGFLGGQAAGIDVLPQSGGGGPSGAGVERPSWAAGTPGPDLHPQDISYEPSESDWDVADDYFELKPEDSASNISSSRHRRPKRRSERRTPAPIEEEEE